MSSVLIIGSSGFLGRRLVERLKEKGIEIGALSRESKSFNNSSIKQYSVDILNAQEIENVISQYEVIINCTGQISSPINQCLAQNTDGIQNIALAVKKYNKRLIQFSSVSVYGSSKYVDEKTEPKPETIYGVCKYLSEKIIENELDHYTILRVSNLYGKGQEKGIFSYILSRFLLGKKTLNFDNDGSLLRYYLDVEDLTNIVYSIVIQPRINGIFNLVGPRKYTIKELISKFEYLLDLNFDVIYEDISPTENINEINATKIQSFIKTNKLNSISKYISQYKH